MLKIVFIVLYFCIRDILNIRHNDKWIGKKEKIIIAIVIPISILVLGIFNYVRSDEEVPDLSPFAIFEDFFYKQGTSFDTLCEGFEYKKELPEFIGKNYTFGLFIDYVQHSVISQKLFGAKGLPNGNSLVNATESNSLAHHLSYLVLGSNYLKGHGRGSSYIIEVYLDYGFGGVIIFNVFLGYFLMQIPLLLKKRWIIKVIVLAILLNICYIPRDSASSAVSFLISSQFWITILGCLIFTKILMVIKINDNLSKS